MFIHGGYWQRNSKDGFSNLIAGLHARGWAGALPGYTLAPDATLTEIVAEINAALGAAPIPLAACARSGSRAATGSGPSARRMPTAGPGGA